MAAMTTALTVFSENGNSRTSITSGHTVSKPKLVIEKRRVPSGNQVVAEYNASVVHGTEDAEGLPLQQKVSFEISVRYPVGADSADIAAAQIIIRDIVASDDFAASVLSQGWL